MLPAKHRLTKEKDFKRINATSRPFFSSFFRLKYSANGLKLSRLAVVVSTKVSKKAVLRNKLQRQIREVIRLNLAKIKSGNDIIISVSNKALNASYQELEKEIFKILTKAKLFK